MTSEMSKAIVIKGIAVASAGICRQQSAISTRTGSAFKAYVAFQCNKLLLKINFFTGFALHQLPKIFCVLVLMLWNHPLSKQNGADSTLEKCMTSVKGKHLV